MNILINTSKALNQNLVERLVKLPQTSIYLALSLEDTQRILHTIQPEILITDKVLLSGNIISNIKDRFPMIEIYLYKTADEPADTYALIPYRECPTKDINHLLPAYQGLFQLITHSQSDADKASAKIQTTNLIRRRS